MRDLWNGHEDVNQNRIQTPLLPIVVIGGKFDQFVAKVDGSLKKKLCMALRYVSHSNGCDLVYASVVEKEASKLFRSMLSCHAFDIPTNTLQPQINPVDAILMPAGKDSLGRIDDPDGA